MGELAELFGFLILVFLGVMLFAADFSVFTLFFVLFALIFIGGLLMGW